MNTRNKTQLRETTVALVAVVGLAAVMIPTVGITAAAGIVGAGLFLMAILESRKHAY